MVFASHLRESRAGSRRSLAVALAMTGAVFLAELVGGILTNSLALLADAGHMASPTWEPCPLA